MLTYWSSCSLPEPRKQRCSPPSTPTRFTRAHRRSAATAKSLGEWRSYGKRGEEGEGEKKGHEGGRNGEREGRREGEREREGGRRRERRRERLTRLASRWYELGRCPQL